VGRPGRKGSSLFSFAASPAGLYYHIATSSFLPRLGASIFPSLLFLSLVLGRLIQSSNGIVEGRRVVRNEGVEAHFNKTPEINDGY
jgi:hypothetical protein